MRLLFIYFYDDFATFEKGSIIHLSKKYKFTFDKEKSIGNEFYFNKEENPNFIEDFYSKNIDIGVLIGENGTGKSVLLNSIINSINEYSIIVYEMQKEIYYIGKSDVIIINELKVNKDNFLKKIYFSSIIDFNKIEFINIYDISDKHFLFLNQKSSINNNLINIETLDLDKYFNMNRKLNYPIPQRVKLYYLNDFFEIIDNKIKDYPNEQRNLFNSIFSLNLLDKELKKIIKESYKKTSINIYDILTNNIKNSYDLINLIISHEIYNSSDFYKEEQEPLKERLNNLIEKEIKKKRIDDILSDEKFMAEYKQKMKYIYDNNKSFWEEIFVGKDFNIRSYKKKKEILDEIKTSLDKLLFNIPKDLKYDISIIILNELNSAIDKNKHNKRCRGLFNFMNSLNLLYVNFQKVNLNLNQSNYDKDELLYRLILTGILKIEKFTEYIEKDNKLDDVFELFLNKLLSKNKNIFQYVESLEFAKLLFISSFAKIVNEFELESKKIKFQNMLSKIYCLIDNIDSFRNFNFSKKSVAYMCDYFKIIEESYIEKKNNLYLELDKDFFKNYKLFVEKDILPYKYIIDPPFSSGQKAILFIFARINHAIQKINQENPNENILILLDEADLKLHLEWQRKFIFDLIEFLNSYPNNKFYVLYATHSPMILSDITNDRVVFLRKREDNSNFSEDKQDFSKSTFGANIYDIYADSFFVDNFMGKFAQNKINEVIKIIEKNKKISDKKASSLLKVIKNIGEPLLRNKLEDEIKSLSELEIKDDISIIADKLRDKNFEEIKQELNKYSQEKQRQILEKLFGNQND